MAQEPTPKEVKWIGSAKEDLSEMPPDVKDVFGQAIFEAQLGGKSPDAKPLKGDAFKGAGVLEVVEDHDGNTYRAVYTVQFAGFVYVLDAFQKKSKSGIATPRHIMERIERRLKTARDDYEQITQASKTLKTK